MKTDVWVLGGGGHAKVAVATLQSAGWPIAGIYDDDPSKQGNQILCTEIVGATPLLDWWQSEPRAAFVAIGENSVRERVSGLPADWVVAQHEAASVHSSVSVGGGTLICAGVVIQPDARIGQHVIANTSCSIDHDCVVEDFAHIAPGVTLAGNVHIGEGAFVGAGSTILPGVKIGAAAIIGAGSVVLRDVEPGAKVVGVPARTLLND
jgi:sugar O-acyltransferase (sialic acid O-acetyltransferase NeuD family)